MLRWAEASTGAFDELLKTKLAEAEREAETSAGLEEWAKGNDLFKCSNLFPDSATFGRECRCLIKKIDSDRVYAPTEAHFYLMWHVLSLYASIDEDDLRTTGNSEECEIWYKVDSSSIGPAEVLKHIEDTYFWDMDFLMKADVINALSSKGRELARLSEGIDSVVNQQQISDEELEMEEVK